MTETNMKPPAGSQRPKYGRVGFRIMAVAAVVVTIIAQGVVPKIPAAAILEGLN
jgi:hypothetical protein